MNSVNYSINLVNHIFFSGLIASFRHPAKYRLQNLINLTFKKKNYIKETFNFFVEKGRCGGGGLFIFIKIFMVGKYLDHQDEENPVE